MSTLTLVIHGGAGTIRKEKMTAEMEGEYRSGLESALGAGYSVLQKGGSAVDAVLASVRSLVLRFVHWKTIFFSMLAAVQFSRKTEARRWMLLSWMEKI
jgi:hypothetical protein